MALRAYAHTEKVGKYKVNDATGHAMQCRKCGDVELTLNELAGYQRRAAALVLREAADVDGAMVKYARKALGMKQTELAERIGCAAETVSRWETGALLIARPEQLAIVAILDGVELAGGLDAYLEQEQSARTSRTLEVVPPRRACGS